MSEKPELEDPLKVSLDTFEKQVLFLKKHYKIISAEQLVDLLKNGESYPDNACLITFDDGWQDNYIHAYPILKKHDLPALMFLSTDYIGTKRIFWHEELRHLLEKIPKNQDVKLLRGTPRKWPAEIEVKIAEIIRTRDRKREVLINDLIIYLKDFVPENVHQLIDELMATSNVLQSSDSSMLSWEQVKEMAGNNISFGSHTKSHAILTQINSQQVKEELSGSKIAIEDKLEKPVYFHSYPNGYYDEESAWIAKDVGYLGCFTCLPGRNTTETSEFELRRKHIREEFSLGVNKKFSELFFKIELLDIRSTFKRWKSSEKY